METLKKIISEELIKIKEETKTIVILLKSYIGLSSRGRGRSIFVQDPVCNFKYSQVWIDYLFFLYLVGHEMQALQKAL